jgi:hypothetical protein
VNAIPLEMVVAAVRELLAAAEDQQDVPSPRVKVAS